MSVDLGELRKPFLDRCRSVGLTPSVVLRDLVRSYLRGADDLPPRTTTATSAPFAQEAGDLDTGPKKRLTLRLTRSELELATELARTEGFALPMWVAYMLRARLTSQAQLGEDELQALMFASYQLRSVGLNLNQAVRALRGSGRESELRLHMLKELTAKVASVSDPVRSVLRSNMRRWRLARVSS